MPLASFCFVPASRPIIGEKCSLQTPATQSACPIRVVGPTWPQRVRFPALTLGLAQHLDGNIQRPVHCFSTEAGRAGPDAVGSPAAASLVDGVGLIADLGKGLV
jgi:hypothetical protein